MRLCSAFSVLLLLVREIYFGILITAAVCQFELLGRPGFAFASLQLGRAATWPTSRWPPLVLVPDSPRGASFSSAPAPPFARTGAHQLRSSRQEEFVEALGPRGRSRYEALAARVQERDRRYEALAAAAGAAGAAVPASPPPPSLSVRVRDCLRDILIGRVHVREYRQRGGSGAIIDGGSGASIARPRTRTARTTSDFSIESLRGGQGTSGATGADALLSTLRLDQFSPRARQRLRESLSTESSASSASYDNVFGGGREEAVVGVEVPPPGEAGGPQIGCREPPNHFLCPITLQPMREPIHAEGELHSYERSALREHLRRNGRWEVQNRDVVFSGKSPIPGKHGKIVYSPWHAWDDGDWTMTRRKLGRPVANCYAFLTKRFAAPNVLRPNWKLKQEIDDWWEEC